MRVILIGTNAQAKYALDIYHYYKDVKVVGLVDIVGDKTIWGKSLYGNLVLGGLDIVETLINRNVDGVLVCCARPGGKEVLTRRARKAGLRLVNAIHPRSTIASTARIGSDGVIINAGAVIQPFARIGNSVMIHANVIVEHDNIIEDYVNLAPGVNLAGWVTVKEGATVCTGAIVIPKVTIGRGAVVGAGAVVLHDVPDDVTIVGVPARKTIHTQEEDE